MKEADAYRAEEGRGMKIEESTLKAEIGCKQQRISGRSVTVCAVQVEATGT